MAEEIVQNQVTEEVVEAEASSGSAGTDQEADLSTSRRFAQDDTSAVAAEEVAAPFVLEPKPVAEPALQPKRTQHPKKRLRSRRFP